MPTEAITSKKPKKLGRKIVTIAAGVLLVACSASAVVTGVNLPSTKRFAVDENVSVYTSSVDDNFIYYGTGEAKLIEVDFDNNIQNEVDFKEEASTYSIDISQINSIDEYNDNLIVYSQLIGSDDGYIFSVDKDSLKITSYTKVEGFGTFRKCTLDEKGNYVVAYRGSKIGNCTNFASFDLNNLAAGYLHHGYFYVGETIRDEEYKDCYYVRRVKPIDIVDMSISDDMCYVTHTGGISAFSLDMEWNCLNDLDATDPDVVAKYGIRYYDAENQEYYLESSKFNFDKYVSIMGEGFCGASVRGDNIYLFSTDNLMYKTTKNRIIGKNFKDVLRKSVVENVSFSYNFVNTGCSFNNAKSNKSYIIFKSSDIIECIDFSADEPVVEFVANFEFGIGNIFTNRDGSELVYLFTNSGKSESGVSIGCFVNTDKFIHFQFAKPVLIASVITGAVLLIVFIIALLCWVKSDFFLKFKSGFKSVLKNKFVYIAMLPSLALLMMFCYYPAIASVVLSFFNYTKDDPSYLWNNFAHYKYIFTNPEILNGFKNMFLFLIVDIVTSIIPPLLFAFFLSTMRHKKVSSVLRTLLFLCGIIPGIAANLIWKEGILGNYGVINSLIKAGGGSIINFLGQSSTAKWAIMLVGFPYVGSYLIFYGGMMNIPSSYYEALELEGAGIMRRFVQIDVPLIFPQIKYVFICSIINSVQNFARVQSITGGSFDTEIPVVQMYDLITEGNYGRASAFAAIIFILLFFATFFTLNKKKKEMHV